MKKLGLLGLLFFSIWGNLYAQSCAVPDILRSEYERDVHHLALVEMQYYNVPELSETDIPASRTTPIWEGLAAVFNSDLPEAAIVFDQICMHHTDLATLTIHDRIYVNIDASVSWYDNWSNGIIETGNTSIDSLFQLYEFEPNGALVNSFQFITNQSLNLEPLTEFLETFSEVNFSEVVPYNSFAEGDKIVYSQNGGTRYYTFQKNWNCTDICNDRRTWGFAVDEDCNVILEVNVGDDISTAPQTNCNLSAQITLGNDCSNPNVITTIPHSGQYSIDSLSSTYGETGICGQTYNREDMVWEYTATSDECIRVTGIGGLDFSLFLTDECPESLAMTCLTSAENEASIAMFETEVVAGETYYIIWAFDDTNGVPISTFELFVYPVVCTIGQGCTDPEAINFDPTATEEDGTCIYGDSIQGIVFFDTNNDCVFDENDIVLDDWVVMANNGSESFYGSSNNEGIYSIIAENGIYDVSVQIPNALWSACEPVINTTIDNEPITIHFPIQGLEECPQMSVDVSTPFLRRCMDNNYTVQYCNEGTVVANNAYIEVVFPDALTPQLSSIPWTSVDDNIYTFNIGTVTVGACESFNISAYLDCTTSLGETFCAEAHIYPDSICTTNPDWDGVWIETDAVCEDDSIRFFIRNIGTENMDTPLEYYVVEDEVMVRQGAYTLASSEEINFARAATGASFYMQCEQSPFHPLNNLPSVGLEGCGIEPHSTGFLLDFPEDDNASFVSIDCQEVIGSFDPNDKRAEPRGYSYSHYIKNDIELEYHIRFQNTGTDTAFLVVIEDVLSNYLNPATIVPGASSHPYEFRLSDRGTVEFIFENILLPDSTTNEAASHGFVKFRISQAENNTNGTVITNMANIYFDYNEPIVTNETWHTIGESFITVGVEEVFMKNVSVLTAPNPFQEYTTFSIKGQEFSSLAFYLYDATGKQVRYTKEQGNEFKFYREELPSGMYFYTIEADGQRLNTGKIVIQ